MQSFAALKRGGKSGPVIVPRDAANSPLVARPAAGEMPPEGPRLAEADLALLRAWVAAGAPFDGADPQQAVVAAPRSNASTRRQPGQSTPATGQATISFVRQIAPLLVEHCGQCHSADRASGGLVVERFQGLAAGGASGDLWQPGNADESLLVQKLRGTAPNGQRMPRGRSPWSDEMIGLVATWIGEGARFDGSAPDVALADLANAAAASALGDEELAERRAQLARAQWSKALPDEPPREATTPRFLVLGTGSAEELAEVGKTAEAQVERLHEKWNLATDTSWFRGRATLLVFRRRADYHEFVRMVERREVAATTEVHARQDGLNCYLAFSLPVEAPATTVDRLLVEGLVALRLQAVADAPGWFVDGSARAWGAAAAKRDPAVSRWNSQVTELLMKHAAPEGFLTDRLPAADSAALAYGFIAQLLAEPVDLRRLLGKLQASEPFEAAWEATYGATPGEMVRDWVARARR